MHRGNLPDGPLRQIIRMEGETYTVQRYTKSVNEIGGVEKATTTHEVDIHVFEPSRSPTQLLHGESFDESLGGLAVADADLQDGDVIEYDGVTFELTVTPIPDEASPTHLSIDLERTDT